MWSCIAAAAAAFAAAIVSTCDVIEAGCTRHA